MYRSPAAADRERPGFLRYLPLALAIWHGLIFFFVLVATPVDAFKTRPGARVRYPCASMFGWKRCGAHAKQAGFDCEIKSNMGGAAAFAIISIFVTLASFIIFVLTLLDIMKKPLLLLIIDGVGCLTLLICWGCVAGAYNGKCNWLPNRNVKDNYKYGGSFGLMVTSWVFQIIALVGVFFVPL